MKKILTVLFTIFSLFLQAQDPKPIPYNAKFLGYVQIASLKDASAQTATMGYVLADSLTGQLYFVPVPTEADTGVVKTTGTGQKVYQSLELLNTSLIKSPSKNFEINSITTDMGTGTSKLKLNTVGVDAGFELSTNKFGVLSEIKTVGPATMVINQNGNGIALTNTEMFIFKPLTLDTIRDISSDSLLTIDATGKVGYKEDISWKEDGNTLGSGGNTLGSKDNRSLRFITNNTQRMLIDSLGNVSMAGTIQVPNITEATQSKIAYISEDGTFYKGDAPSSAPDSTVFATIARVNQQVTDTGKAIRPIIWSKNGNTLGSGGNTIGSKDNRSLRFITNNTQRLIVDSLGKVGIGVTPTQALDVYGGARIGNGGGDNAANSLTFNGANHYIRNVGSSDFRINFNGFLYLQEGGTSRMYFNNGLFSPSNNLSVNLGTTSTSFNDLYIDDITGYGQSDFNITMQNQTTSNTRGNNIKIIASGATSDASDKSGGDVQIKTGTSEGNNAAGIYFYSPDTLQGTGSTQRTQSLQASLDYRGLKLYGNATQWNDLFFPFETGQNGLAAYPSFNADSLYYNWTIDSTGPAQCVKYFTVQMPHDWKEGSTIYPHVHYKHETTQGTPSFRLKYRWINIGAINPAWNLYDMTSTTGTTANTHQMCYRSANGISGTGKTISSILLVQLYLFGQTGTGDIHAYQFDIHYERDGLGSQTETTKY